MREKMIALYCKVYTAAYNFKTKEKGAVDIVAIVILIAVAIGLAVIFRKQLTTLLKSWFGRIGSAGDDAIESGVAGSN